MNASQKNVVSSHAIAFESLENRTMMSVAPFVAARKKQPKKVIPAPAPAIVVPVPVVAPVSVSPNGSTVQITGSTGNDQMYLSQSGSTFILSNGSWQTTFSGTFTKIIVKGNGGNDSITLDASVTENADLYGASGNDTLNGGSGSDRIFAGAGSNIINGGAGNDTIVTVGSTSDVVTGGAGTDSFWLDSATTETVADMSAVENSAKHVHRVGSFLGGVSTSLAGQNLADPKTTSASMTYKNFATLPLFNDAGPAEDDVVQGYAGDCWFLSTVSSMAKVNSDVIRQSIVDLGDGTYAVQFNRGGQSVFVRVDADLPTWYDQAAYADVVNGAGQSSLWVALMEKALTEFRGSATAPTYSCLDGGWMTEACSDLGINNNTSIWGAASAPDWAKQLSDALAANKSVTYATKSNPTGALIGNHAYTVDHMGVDATGHKTITLRNPWGVDGAGSDGANDGYVTMTIEQAFANTIGCVVAIV